MDIYTVSFFGHRDFKQTMRLENRFDKLLRDIIMQKEYVRFLIGREGGFDLFATSVIKQAIYKYSHNNTSFILILPYMREEFRREKQSYLEYYDHVKLCTESASTHYRAAIPIRNERMIDASDLVICYIDHHSGGAYKAMQYAQKRNCRVMNLAYEN